jgi:hypothetical protein
VSKSSLRHRVGLIGAKDVLMLKATVVAVWGLAVGHSLVLAEDRPDNRQTVGSVTQDRLMLTTADIVHIKAVLKLTREQEQYWPPVETALRAIAGHAAQGTAWVSQPAVLDQAKMQRLAAAAAPLLMRLDDGQRRAAAALARSVGLGPLLAAF